MDTPARRCHTRTLRRASTALLSGELAREPTRTGSGAARVSAAPATRKHALPFSRSKAALLVTIAVALTALVTSWPTDSCSRSVAREIAPSHRVRPAAALDRRATVREPERRQGAGVLLRRPHRGTAQLADRESTSCRLQRAPPRSPSKNTRTLPPLPTSSTLRQCLRGA